MLSFLLTISVVPAGQIFECTPTRVWDGDGPIWCAEGPLIRVSGIAAPEMDGTCRQGHPCVAVDPVVARDALVQLIGSPRGLADEGHVLVVGPTMSCRSDGSAGGKRTAAFCISPKSGDISCKMVLGGWAARWDRYWREHKCED